MPNYLLLIANIIFCSYFIIRGMINTERIYRSSFWAMVVNLIFILLPCFSYLDDDNLAPHLTRFLIMVLLSEIAWAWGEKVGLSLSPRFPLPPRLDEINHYRWLAVSMLLSLLGMVAYIQVNRLFYAGASMVTGAATIYTFFSVFLQFGFIMAILGVFGFQEVNLGIRILCVLPGLYYFFSRIVLFGRRQNMMEFFIIIILTMWYIFKKRVPRWVLVVSIIGGSMLMFSIGAYRKYVVVSSGERQWGELEHIEWSDALLERPDSGSSETLTGIYVMATTDLLGKYDFGSYHWDQLVFNFIPAQLLGADFKRSLMIEPDDIGEEMYSNFSFSVPRGSTYCGVTDCYCSFWYFGVVKFFIIAYIMARIHHRSMKGDIRWQGIYMYMMTMALHAITHHTSWFINPWVLVILVWWPAMLFCRNTAPREVDNGLAA